MYIKAFISLIIVLLSYKIVANLISKKNIFTKRIEIKICNIVNKITIYFNQEVNKLQLQNDNDISIKTIFNIINNVFNNKFFKTIELRQNFRNKYKNFIEYNNSICEFKLFSTKDDLKSRYKEILNTKQYYIYEQKFFANFNIFINKN